MGFDFAQPDRKGVFYFNSFSNIPLTPLKWGILFLETWILLLVT
ncbi:hypothetical protein CCAN12_790030 [Capnocytophaga canimorsus]|uniref:Uncharacterized protein n=1 Tax=Capnocytophaga canimorsus TaxID=28188 RepID=A0A0B7HLD6_9FLAO|nr:hypothetical protein CCAN12_790030 [Capnocytophaga canimorsus]